MSYNLKSTAEKAKESVIIRTRSKTFLNTPMAYNYLLDATSLGELFHTVCSKWSNRVAVLRNEGAGFEPLTYKELYQKVHEVACGLKNLGVEKGDRVAIISENCMEWSLVDWAAQTLGVITVPIYTTLPPDQIEYIIENSGAKVAFAGTELVAEKLKNIDNVTTVVLKTKDGKLPHAQLKKFIQDGKGALSSNQWQEISQEIKKDDIATIIYTSGTTGVPKGVMLENKSFLHVCYAAQKVLPINQTDVYLSFLPLSHVFERAVGHVLPTSLGSCVAYAQNLASLNKDLQTVKPTVMLCVPRLLEAIQQRILDNVSKQSKFKQKLFWFAYHQGLRRAQRKFAPLAWLTDRLVGKTIRERTGGKVRYFVSGGAALDPDLCNFYLAFGFNMIQGYGLTETCAYTTLNHPERNNVQSVGETAWGTEIKIAKDGEILVKGPTLMKGYYKMPKETEQVIDSKGWFHTGDIGKFEGKHLCITDRKKDLIILANGKNVAPQPIENKLKQKSLIQEVVLFGDTSESLCALIIPNKEVLNTKLLETGAGKIAEEEWSSSDIVKSLIKEQISSVNKNLAAFEKVKRFEVINATFSVESGELTPSMKVKRNVVKEKYKVIIEKMLK